MFQSIDVSTSGLVAQRARMDTIAGNIANALTTRDADGNLEPFRRRLVTFSAVEPQGKPGGAAVSYQVEVDTAAVPRRVYNPGHPDSDLDGYVAYPDINLITESVNAMEAGRAYEANIAAMEMTKEMANLALRILA